MSDDLVKRLRDRGVCSLEHNSCRNDMVCDQAADRIEALEAKLEKLEAEEFTVGTLTMKHVFRPSGLTNVSDMQAVFDATERGFEELEAKLAKAVEEAEKYQRAFAAQSRKLQAVLHIEGVRAALKGEDNN